MHSNYVLDETKIYFLKIKNLIEKRGFTFVIRLLIGVIFGYYFYKIFRSSRTFIFQNNSYKYFYHPYNVTWMSERAVEIPIIWRTVENHQGEQILEVGNVLSHYYDINHCVLDKHERGRGVINQDVVDFKPRRKYNLIVSISTLEHVGWDENIKNKERDPQKIFYAIDNLKRCLAHGGKIIVTLPVGQNLNMDKLIRDRKIVFSELYFLKRISADNEWIETDFEHVANIRYDEPYIGANGIIIGIISDE